MNMLRHQKTCTKNIEKVLDEKEKQQMNDKIIFRQILQNGDQMINGEILKSFELGNDQLIFKHLTEQNKNNKNKEMPQNSIFNVPQSDIHRKIEPQKSDSFNTKWKKIQKILNENQKFFKSNSSLLGNRKSSHNNISDLTNSQNLILNSMTSPNVSNITPISNALNSFLQGKSFDSCLNTIDMKILEESENSNKTSLLKNLTLNSLVEENSQQSNSNIKELITKFNELTFIDNKHINTQDSPKNNRIINNNIFLDPQNPINNLDINTISMQNNQIINSDTQNKNFFQKVEREQKIIKINSKKRFHPIIEFSDTKLQTQNMNVSSQIGPQKRDKLGFQSMEKKSKSPCTKIFTNSFKENPNNSILK